MSDCSPCTSIQPHDTHVEQQLPMTPDVLQVGQLVPLHLSWPTNGQQLH